MGCNGQEPPTRAVPDTLRDTELNLPVSAALSIEKTLLHFVHTQTCKPTISKAPEELSMSNESAETVSVAYSDSMDFEKAALVRTDINRTLQACDSDPNSSSPKANHDAGCFAVSISGSMPTCQCVKNLSDVLSSGGGLHKKQKADADEPIAGLAPGNSHSAQSEGTVTLHCVSPFELLQERNPQEAILIVAQNTIWEEEERHHPCLERQELVVKEWADKMSNGLKQDALHGDTSSHGNLAGEIVGAHRTLNSPLADESLDPREMISSHNGRVQNDNFNKFQPCWPSESSEFKEEGMKTQADTLSKLVANFPQEGGCNSDPSKDTSFSLESFLEVDVIASASRMSAVESCSSEKQLANIMVVPHTDLSWERADIKQERFGAKASNIPEEDVLSSGVMTIAVTNVDNLTFNNIISPSENSYRAYSMLEISEALSLKSVDLNDPISLGYPLALTI